ncbi:MAG: porphobilinogen synthase [Bacteroidia bacterium]|nr:porphobilinogen synthase [Bacteroidia bacterium]
MIYRPRRLRINPIIREVAAEVRFHKDMLVYPYFVEKGKNITAPISSMPGINHFSPDMLVKDVERGLKKGINKVLLFGSGEEKSAEGKAAYNKDTIVAQAVKALKKNFKDELYIITDVCLCAYTSHGHCGIIRNGRVHNDLSVAALVRMALVHAEAGADMVAPSDMMDGRVGIIRQALDDANLTDTAIMAYSIKFASAYYGPFREAADSTPQFGDRKSYQMDFRNPNEAMKEAGLDEAEGADILMVKPALAYLDVVARLRQQTLLPVACYNVSGEYSMVKAAAGRKWIDEKSVVMENMHAFARAGAGLIITYHARDISDNGW